MSSPIVTTPSPPEPTIAIVMSFVVIGTLTFLPGARVSARSGHSVREYERMAHDANSPTDRDDKARSELREGPGLLSTLNSQLSTLNRSEGEAAGEVG